MIRALLQIALNGVAVLVAAYLVPGILYTGSLPALLLVGLVVGLINLIVKPIVTFFSFPLILLTLGLFYLVINGLMLYLAAWLLPRPPAGERLRRGDPGRPGDGAGQLARAGLHLGVAGRCDRHHSRQARRSRQQARRRAGGGDPGAAARRRTRRSGSRSTSRARSSS